MDLPALNRSMRGIAAMTLSAILSGCSTFDNNEFACAGGEGDALCGSSRAIIKLTDGPMAENEAVTVIKDGEVVETLRGQAPGQRHPGTSISSPSRVPPVPAQPLTHYRTPGQVIRIWLAPWTDSGDQLHLASTVLSDVRPRTWQVNGQTLLRPQDTLGTSSYRTVKPATPSAVSAVPRPEALDASALRTSRSSGNTSVPHR